MKISIYKNLDIYPGGKLKVISGEEEGKPGLKSGQNPGSQGQEEPEMLGNEIYIFFSSTKHKRSISKS